MGSLQCKQLCLHVGTFCFCIGCFDDIPVVELVVTPVEGRAVDCGVGPVDGADDVVTRVRGTIRAIDSGWLQKLQRTKIC